jgi:hypothetical protein
MNASQGFSPEFQAYGAWVAAVAIHQQDLFNDALGDGHQHANLDTRTLTGDRGVLSGVTLLGSFSHSDHSWLWAWANPHFGPADPASAATLTIRDFGERYGITEFITDSPDLSGFPQPAQAAATLAITAGTVLRGRGIYSTSINDGQGHVYMHVADEQLPLAPFDPIVTPRLLLTAVSVFPADHRQVVRGYFQHYGTQYAETPDALRGTGPDGSTVVTTFDEHNRLSNVSIEPA